MLYSLAFAETPKVSCQGGCIAHTVPLDHQQHIKKINCYNTGGCLCNAWIHDVCDTDTSEHWICSKYCKDQVALLNTGKRVRISKKKSDV